MRSRVRSRCEINSGRPELDERNGAVHDHDRGRIFFMSLLAAWVPRDFRKPAADEQPQTDRGGQHFCLPPRVTCRALTFNYYSGSGPTRRAELTGNRGSINWFTVAVEERGRRTHDPPRGPAHVEIELDEVPGIY